MSPAPALGLYEYAVILDEKRDRDGEIVEETEIIVPVTPIVARDDNQAQMIAAHAVPDEIMKKKLDRLIVVVRPF